MIGTELCDAFDGIDFLPAQVAVMRDGVQLVADIYRPRGHGPWPVLLMRQPYGRDIASTVVYAHPTWWARQGFLVVIQDVRGRGDSQGEFYPFRSEKDDGYDTVAWAASLDGSNGRVGMYGFSYQASTQLLAALSQPPALKALAPHMTAFDLYSGWFYRNGILQLSTSLAWANQMLREDAKRHGAASYEALEESYLATGRLSTRFPLKDIPTLTAEDLPTYAQDWLQHSQPGGYWQEFDLLSRVEELKVPMFHLSGWYDLYLRGSVDGYVAMQRAHPDQFLLASPWIHLPWGNKIGTADLGPQAVPDVDRAMASWFHHYLDHYQPMSPPPFRGARYFILGKNQWQDSSAWPPPEATESTWFLQSQGRANSRFGDGALSSEGAEGPEDLFNYDPEVPFQAPGGNLAGSASFGPHDLSAQQQGINVLVYTSPSLACETVIAGHPLVILHFRSSAPSTHVVVRLSRVTADGRAQFLTLGATVARASKGDEIRIPLDPIAASFGSGEAIRLDIASSSFPLLIRHPNTDTDPSAIQSPAEFKRALQIVYHNAKQPSRLILPVLST